MSTHTWSWIHKWSNLVCTVFMLLLCLTGLPLIFHEEIEHLTGVVEAPPMPAGTPNASLDRVAQAALERRPGEVIRYMFWEQDEHPDITYVSMASAVDAPPEENHAVIVASRSAQVLAEPKTNEGFIYVMLKSSEESRAGTEGGSRLRFGVYTYHLKKK